MPATELADLDLLKAAALRAGDIARSFAADPTTLNISDKPEGAGPVTAADLAVNAMLEDTLRSARPGYGWLSEESHDTSARQEAERVFIVDPIDGTRAYINGDRTWAHSLAIAKGGIVQAAVVYLPMRDEMFAASAGGGAYLNRAAIRVGPRTELAGATVLTTRPALKPEYWPEGLPDLRVNYRPSLAYRLCAVAQGRFDAMITFRPSWEWDIAAGELILREAGAAVSDRNGAALRFNNADPRVDGVLAGAPPLHAELCAAVARR